MAEAADIRAEYRACESARVEWKRLQRIGYLASRSHAAKALEETNVRGKRLLTRR
jgi:hypothetical protein